MMTYKEKLVKFVKLKKEHIEKFGFVYADHRDYNDIRSWTEKRCKKIYKSIVEGITSHDEYSGLYNTTCPWCVYNEHEDDQCLLCNYGKRHGECNEEDSLYGKYVTKEVRESFTNEVYRDMINKIDW